MKLKIQILEGFHTTIWKEPIEIETDNYPQLKDMDREEALEYIKNKSNDIPFYDSNKTDEDWSLFEELMNQDTEYTKEKNYETDVIEVRD